MRSKRSFLGTAVAAAATLAGGLAAAAVVAGGAGARPAVTLPTGSTPSNATTTPVPVAPPPSFAPAVALDVGEAPRSIAIGDLNHDGAPDLAVGVDDAVDVLAGGGDGTFSTSFYATIDGGPSFLAPASVAIADLNGDGNPDLVTPAYGTAGISVVAGNGDGTFQAHQEFPLGFTPPRVASGDFNGDGKADIVVPDDGTVGAPGSTISVLLASGGTWTTASYAVGTGPDSVAVGDLNGDGKLDLAVANGADGTVSVLLGNGDGSFQPQTSTATGGDPVSIAIGDVNGDGTADVVTANGDNGTVSVLLGNGDGSFQPPTSVAVGGLLVSVAIADLNGDGRRDLLTLGDNASTLSVLVGNGDGSFQAPATVTLGAAATAVAIGDLNGDGYPDLAVANFSDCNCDGSVSVLLNEGASGGGSATTTTSADTTTTATTTSADTTTSIADTITTPSPSAAVSAQVLPALTVSLDKASLDFGSLLPKASTSRSVTATVTSNDGAGYQLDVSRTAFVPGDLPLSIACASCGLAATPVPVDSLQTVVSTADVSADSGDAWPATLTLGPIPGATRSGSYSSTLTFTVVGL